MIVRSLVLVVDGGIFLIGLIAVLSTRFHRRIGDLVAGTYVVAKAGAGQAIALAPSAVPYGGAFAVPGGGPPGGFAAPAAPAAFVPGWGVAQDPPPPPPPPPPNPASAAWNAPPSPTLPGRPPTASPAAPSPPPSILAPPAPSPPVPPPPAPIAAPPLPATLVRPVVPEPTPAVGAQRQAVPQPEAWWDTAIPADPPDGEEQP
jgi:hypothetical protein